MKSGRNSASIVKPFNVKSGMNWTIKAVLHLTQKLKLDCKWTLKVDISRASVKMDSTDCLQHSHLAITMILRPCSAYNLSLTLQLWHVHSRCSVVLRKMLMKADCIFKGRFKQVVLRGQWVFCCPLNLMTRQKTPWRTHSHGTYFVESVKYVR